ncbi:polysaccharide deacetylase family protein, partial [Streptomyces muensis]|nr:polysaccharide deacetylase family protein [Streptomyces muensis]
MRQTPGPRGPAAVVLAAVVLASTLLTGCARPTATVAPEAAQSDGRSYSARSAKGPTHTAQPYRRWGLTAPL